MSLAGWVFIIVCAVFAVAANFLFKVAIQSQTDFNGQIVDYLRLFLQPIFIVGLFFYGLAMITWIKVLSSEPMNLAYPILSSIAFALVIMGAAFFFKESLSLVKIVGIIVIIIGITITAQG